MYRSAACLLPLLVAAPALAQETTTPPAIDVNADRVTLGVGVATVPDYEGSDNSTITPLPAAIGKVHNFGFQLLGNQLSIDLIPDHSSSGVNFQFGPIGVVNFDRSKTSRIDDPRVKALGKVGTAIELGGYAGISKTGVFTSPYDTLSFSVSYRHDVSDKHDSEIWSPSISYMTPLSRHALVGLSGTANHVGTGYARTYFSVTPAQSVASGLPVYTARRGWKDWNLSAYTMVSLTGDLTHGLGLVVGGNYKRLINDFGDSPVVRIAGSRNQWVGAAGLAYTF